MSDILLRPTDAAAAEIAPATDTRLGAAIAALLNATDADVAAATGSLAPDAQAPAARAILAVEEFLLGATSGASWHFIAPLIDQCARKKRGGRSYTRATVLISWILGHPTLGAAAALAID